MKKYIIRFLLLLLFPMLLFTGAFLLPTQYEETFLGELKYKCERLRTTEAKKIVFVGGSSVAFGIDSKLVKQEFPEYEVVNFGMYAALGTESMLDLSKGSIREGDLVVVIPEQQAQSLSVYFNGDAMWQALDGAFGILREIPQENLGELMGALPRFSAEKWKYVLTNTKPNPEGVYCRSVFNEYGDLESEIPAANIMQDGFDANMPILFEKEILEPAFAEKLNDYARSVQQAGATMWYHFCPMNALAVERNAEIEKYYDDLQGMLEFEIAGNPKDCILDAGWFFDTNFHLNQAGKTVFTKQLIEDMKAMLGEDSKTEILLPEMPAYVAGNTEEGTEEQSLEFFSVELSEDAVLTGLTGEGMLQKELVVPFSYNGETIHKISTEVFRGNQTIERIFLQSNITWIEDGAFDGCDNLKELILLQEDPSKCLVGQNLLEGTNCRILVPSGCAEKYKLHYWWSLYSSRISEIKE